MLIKESHIDVPTKADGTGTMRTMPHQIQVFHADSSGGTGIFLFYPTILKFPKAKFPGVVLFSEIYQGLSRSSHNFLSQSLPLSVKLLFNPVSISIHA